MTQDEFAAALSRLVGEAEDAGLDPQEILVEIEDMGEAMRLCVDEYPTAFSTLCHPASRSARRRAL